jgi:hypothetical protein
MIFLLSRREPDAYLLLLMTLRRTVQKIFATLDRRETYLSNEREWGGEQGSLDVANMALHAVFGNRRT